MCLCVCVCHGPPADLCLKKNLIGRQLEYGRSRTPHVHCKAVLLQVPGEVTSGEQMDTNGGE